MSGGVGVITCPGHGAIYVFEEVMAKFHLQDGDEVDVGTMWTLCDLNLAVLRAHEDARTVRDASLCRALDEIETVISRRNAIDEGGI